MNSYGLNRAKCKYIESKNKCVSILPTDINSDNNIEKSIDINRDYIFKTSGGRPDYNKSKLWNEAITKAIQYVKQVSLIKKINEDEIQSLASEQKTRLNDYLKQLSIVNLPSKLDKIVDDNVPFTNPKEYLEIVVGKINDEDTPLPAGWEAKIDKNDKKYYINAVEKLIEYTRPSPLNTGPITTSVYRTIGLPQIVFKNKSLSSKQLKINNKYLLPNNEILILDKIENGKYYFSDLNEISNFTEILPIGTLIRETHVSELIQNTNFKISKTDLEFINNPPANFAYNLIEHVYTTQKEKISITKKINKSNIVPYEFLFLEYNNLKLDNMTINLDVIYNAMGRVAYNTYEKKPNNFLDSKDIFPASPEAKIFAIKYSVNILALSHKIEGDIKLQDVIDEKNNILPIIKSILSQIVSQLEYGILNKDTKLLKKYIKIADNKIKQMDEDKVADINMLSNLISKANEALIEAEQKKTLIQLDKEESDKLKKIKLQETEITIKKEQDTVFSYLPTPRRKKKL